MTFWDRFVRLCYANSTTPTAVAVAIGAASGSVTRWKRGSAPRDTTLLKIAQYFDVSADYLRGTSDKTQSESTLTPDEQRLLALFAKLSEVERLRLILELQDKLGGIQ